MKILNIITIFALLMSFVAVAQDEIYSKEQLDLEVKIKSKINLDISAGSDLEYVNADLYMFPKDSWRQRVVSEETFPAVTEKEDFIRYSWDELTSNNLNYEITSRVLTENKFRKVMKKVEFPFAVDEREKIYLNPSEYIDSDDSQIVKVASELAEGEDDLFKLENKLANYVKNRIEYNLSTVTAEVTQKASWVLENEIGVCDELTALFVAMNRALGIPARFVSGVAYTNSPLFSEPWGAHAWAEVYFPGYGWVPFDITYEEFGYLDATHIEMMTTVDARQSSTRFEWKGRNIDVVTSPLDIETNVINSVGTVEPSVKIKPFLFDEEVGYGSYNLVGAEIKNLKNYYVPATVYLSNTEGLSTLTENPLHIVLEPGEAKAVYWIFQVDKGLDGPGYIHPMTVYTKFNESGSTSVESGKRSTVYSYEEISDYYNLVIEEVEKTYSSSVDVECVTDTDYVYVNETELVECSLRNLGNTVLTDLDVCLGECLKLELLIGQEEKVEFEFTPKELGEIPVVSVKNGEVSKTHNLNIEVLDKPSLEIRDIKNPDAVTYDDFYNVSFTLEQKSKSTLQNLTVELRKEKLVHKWEVIESEPEYSLGLTGMKGKDLNEGNNTFKIRAIHYDEKGRPYETIEEFNVRLEGLNFWQKIIVWFNGLFS